jgi:hypothetical protein
MIAIDALILSSFSFTVLMMFLSYLNFVRTAFESTPEQDLERYTRKLERRKLELCVSREMMLSIKSNLLMKINELDAVLSEVPFRLRYIVYCC